MELDLDSPATYRIRVKGYLASSWSDRLGGLAITTSQDDETVETTLYGQVVDQAALAGVLSALYNMQLPLLSVECLGELEDGATAG
jgi:hypothetical protein